MKGSRGANRQKKGNQNVGASAVGTADEASVVSSSTNTPADGASAVDASGASGAPGAAGAPDAVGAVGAASSSDAPATGASNASDASLETANAPADNVNCGMGSAV